MDNLRQSIHVSHTAGGSGNSAGKGAWAASIMCVYGDSPGISNDSIDLIDEYGGTAT